MITKKVLNSLEYKKVLEKVSGFAVLAATKHRLLNAVPAEEFEDAALLLDITKEADRLLYTHAVSGVDFFDEITDELDRAAKGAMLSCAELLRAMRLMQSSRITRKSVTSVEDESIVYLRRTAETLYCDGYLENSIREKIVSDEAVSDNASETLYQLRRKIKKINDQIREKLASYVRGGKMKYLQENIITMRGDRYVIPVKSEYKNQIKGLVHDQSATGATVFIEPEAVLELNNELKTATIEEALEVERILRDLSHSVGMIATQLKGNIDLLCDIDMAFSKAEYAYKTRSVMPILNNRGYVLIKKGRHPLIDSEKVVPLDVEFGKDYRFLLITGPNTGGKTVTLKLVGLFSLMAASGIFVPATDGTCVAFFKDIFADIGDEQSIEQSLSTFSSHMRNIVNITEKAGPDSLILLDEIGAGTDPDEGSALAQAVIERLIERGSYGIITTHYSRLKEFAYSCDSIMNASMDFDSDTFAPLYRVIIGMPGSSNAIEISKRLGLDMSIAENAYSLLSDNKVSFENVLRQAEKSRQDAESVRDEYYRVKREADEEAERLRIDRAKFEADKQRFLLNAKAEARRIVNERSDIADELIEEIKEILKKENLDSGDLIRARTLKNKIDDAKYDVEEEAEITGTSKPVDINTLKVGDTVFVQSTGGVATVQRISLKKKEAEVMAGSVRLTVKISGLYSVNQPKQTKSKPKASVSIIRDSTPAAVKTEINVIGQNVDEALINVEQFIDSCLLHNVEECRIVHGKGLNILAKAIQGYLKKHSRVKEFRFGVYGEGEKGVTIAKLK